MTPPRFCRPTRANRRTTERERAVDTHSGGGEVVVTVSDSSFDERERERNTLCVCICICVKEKRRVESDKEKKEEEGEERDEGGREGEKVTVRVRGVLCVERAFGGTWSEEDACVVRERAFSQCGRLWRRKVRSERKIQQANCVDTHRKTYTHTLCVRVGRKCV